MKKEMRHKDFAFVGRLLKSFPSGEIYLVGGAVRDLILGRPTKDFDFVVRGVSAKKLEKFLSTQGHVDLVGRHFGVFKFLSKGRSEEPFDIALPRTEHSTDEGGYKTFNVQSDAALPIEEDLGRRDFTINAIAYRLKAGRGGFLLSEVIDPWEGAKDIKKKIIRTVGKAEDRFAEDYSRMLRGLRFSLQLGFALEPGTKRSIKSLIKKINDVKKSVRVVPTEVIAREFLKSLVADPAGTLDLWDEAGASAVLMPEMMAMKGCEQPKNFHTEGDVWTHTRLALSRLSSKEFKREFGAERPDAETVLGVMFHDIGKPPTKQTPEEHGTDRIRFNGHDARGAQMAKDICRRLTLSAPAEFGIDAERIAGIVQHHLITVHGQVGQLRNNTMEKYFFNPAFPGEALLKVIFCDSSATMPEKGLPDLGHFFELKKRIAKLKKLSSKRTLLPPPILSGDEIMKILHIKQGPQVGAFIRDLREEQLSERVKTAAQAVAFLKRKISGL